MTPSLHHLVRGRVVAAIAAWTVVGAIALPAQGRGAEASGASGAKGISESALQTWETRTLGARHAAEHAQLRRLKRRPGERARIARELKRAGLRARKSAVAPANVGGQWNGRFDIPVIGINAAMLPTGKVLWYAYPNHPDLAPQRNEAWGVLWDPTKGTDATAFRRVDPPIDPRTGKPVNIWCSGTSFLADGRVLVTGGNLDYVDTPGVRYSGLNHAYTFNPFNETWTRQPDMAHGRWYPSQLLMPDGRTIIIQGLDESRTGAKNRDVEVFAPSPDLNGRGTITKVGTLPNEFTGDFYPHTFWLPSGRGLVAGPFIEDSYFLNVPASAATFADAPDISRRREWGTAVLEPGTAAGSTSVLELGGSDTTADYDNAPATSSTERFDEANPGAGWQPASPLNVGRSHANTVLLPDGSMVTVGGGVGSDVTSPGSSRLWTYRSEHTQVELWDPASKTWSLGPSQLEGRTYHSTAILLPDGRVLSAGDDRNGGIDRDSAELYEPPYLHKGPRPTIAQAPTAVGWNTDFTVGTPDANATRAMLIAPGAATHAVDMNQRAIPLALTGQGAGAKTFRTPANANVALPGYYMLFLVNDQGVPSVAKWFRLRPGATENPAAPAPPPSPAPAPPAPNSAGPAARLPSVRATIVHRKGKRVIRVTVAKSTAPKAKIELRLRDRRARTVGKGTRTLRTGRTTIVRSPKVPRAARTVHARALALVQGAGPSSQPSTRGTIERRGGRRVIRLALGRSSSPTVQVLVELRNRQGKVIRRRTRRLRTGRTVILRSPRVTPAIRSVRVRVR